MGAVHLGERLPRDRALRHPLQLVPVPGELLRPVHFEWMHENWSVRLNGETAPYAAKHLKLVFEEFDYGFIYKRVREGQKDGDPVWTVGRVTLWPNGFYLGNHFEWRVPIDDENTLSVCWFFMRVPKGREPYVQDKVPTWVSPIKDDERPLDLEPRHQPGHHRLGRAGHDRRPHQGEPRRAATSASR